MVLVIYLNKTMRNNTNILILNLAVRAENGRYSIKSFLELPLNFNIIAIITFCLDRKLSKLKQNGPIKSRNFGDNGNIEVEMAKRTLSDSHRFQWKVCVKSINPLKVQMLSLKLFRLLIPPASANKCSGAFISPIILSYTS